MAYLMTPAFVPRYHPQFIFDGTSSDFFWTTLKDLRRGVTIDPEAIPKSATEKTKLKSIPDLVMIDGHWAVSANLRQLIESLDSDIHQFFPIRLKRGLKNSFDLEHYLINARSPIDAIILEKSDIFWETLKSGEKIGVMNSGNPRSVIDKMKIKCRHLWREAVNFTEFMFISDTLFLRMKEIKCKGANYNYIPEE